MRYGLCIHCFVESSSAGAVKHGPPSSRRSLFALLGAYNRPSCCQNPAPLRTVKAYLQVTPCLRKFELLAGHAPLAGIPPKPGCRKQSRVMFSCREVRSVLLPSPHIRSRSPQSNRDMSAVSTLDWRNPFNLSAYSLPEHAAYISNPPQIPHRVHYCAIVAQNLHRDPVPIPQQLVEFVR